jgi:Nucleotide-diphospho-sugar transferase
MTGAAQPTEAGPVIALLCTRGMEAFLLNAIQGILQTGIDASQIIVGCPNNALSSVKSSVRLHSVQVQVISTQELSENEAELEKYSSFGSRSFTDISWKKIFFIRHLIELHPHVIYADLDISWIRNPLPYLMEVAKVYPLAIQTEGLPRFPPAFCCGFASFVKSEKAIAFLDALIEFNSAQLDSDNRLDDQVACQQLIEKDLTWLHDIYCLPEALFLNGLGYRNLQNDAAGPCPMEGELLPFLFHANWTVGIDNKRKLLTSTGTWLLGDSPQIDATLLTVIYPIFDVRGDAVERLRLWTEEQDFDPHGYRVVVVAGTATDLDETALRKVLRNQDGILRVPGAGRDADYWNAGAREATTRWLLFVEGHGMPERDSLSALAAWIAANPNGEACNFRIKNSEDHRVARLMKRWFAETQTNWTDPSTWRRLHRTACTIRRDVFEDIGPFEPEYGQFAPPLLSARMHQRGLSISALPTSGIMHDDSLEISVHHDDTADYVRGEMDARADNDPVFFEKYFGPPPSQGQNMIVPARYARSIVKGLVVAALHRPAQAPHLLRQAFALLPAALLSLQNRVWLLAAVTRVDEWLLMHSPLTEAVRWKRFLLAHGRLVRTEQMLWMARHPLPPIQFGAAEQRWPITQIGAYAIIGLHALEQIGEAAFRWAHPVFLLRLAAAAKGVLTLETRNLRSGIGLSDITVVVGARMLSPNEIELDNSGNIKLNVRPPLTPEADTDIVIIVNELSEPPVENGRGRRLGLPLFSVGFLCDGPQILGRT